MSDEKRLQRALLDDDQRTLENIVVLYLSQAMLGLVSANLRAVAAEVTPDRLMIHFAFSELSQQDREDVEDIVADLDALLDNEVIAAAWRIEAVVHLGGADTDWPGRACRRVFEAKPLDSSAPASSDEHQGTS